MTETLDPLVSLAFALRANPGVYALLLGSGVSRSAGIPTGWEVVLDLIRRIAAAQSEATGEKPDQWYAEKFGKEPGYSDLLDALCRTQVERQQLLKSYFEPTADEREQGLKLPTPAHHAVAELMEAGLVRVVVTTNFDRLLEQALEQRGIVPTVIGSPDQAVGMVPLAHQKHCIIKVHGDYLDTRILNTEDELASYDPAMAGLVDRVFDEFGLITCGWSATWDSALRASIVRSPNRRYSCYWTTTGEPTDEAKVVVADRRAAVVTIKSADNFFDGLLARVRGLEEFERPHPLSVQAAVGAAKRYLADDSQRIRLHDLYQDAVTEAQSIWTGPTFPMHGSPAPDKATIAARIKAYDAAASTVVALNIAIGRWSRGEQDGLLADAIGTVGRDTPNSGGGYTVWCNLRAYPATLLLYAGGMAAILANRPALLSRLMTAPTPTINNRDAVAASHLVAPRICEREHLWGLFDGAQRHVPMSDWLHNTLRDAFRSYVRDDEDYDLLFDTLEYYLAIAYKAVLPTSSGWAPFGAWAAYRHRTHDAIVKGLEGSTVAFAGKAFADGCEALSRNGKTLSENAAEVEEFRKKLSFF